MLVPHLALGALRTAREAHVRNGGAETMQQQLKMKQVNWLSTYAFRLIQTKEDDIRHFILYCYSAGYAAQIKNWHISATKYLRS